MLIPNFFDYKKKENIIKSLIFKNYALKIEELEEILSDTDKIVENKLQRLNTALRTLMTDKKTKLSPEKIGNQILELS